MTMKKVAKLEEELTCQFKIGMRNLTILIRALENLKNLHFNGLPLAKVYDVSVKKVRRSYVWWHWILMQNLKENGLSLSKMTWGIWEIFTRALESLEIWTWWDSFIQSRECMRLKFTGELFVMTMKKKICKIGRGIDLSFQNWHEDFDEFWPEHSKISKICTLGLLLTKVYNVSVKKVQRSYVWWHYKIWKKTDFCFQKWHEEFGKFLPEHLKVYKMVLWRDSFI